MTKRDEEGYKNMRVFLSCLILVCFSVQAQAAGCYNSSEAEAEQGIRIHSELMVIGLNCQHMTPRGWKNFYQEYREITSRYRDLFSGYEQTLIIIHAMAAEPRKRCMICARLLPMKCQRMPPKCALTFFVRLTPPVSRLWLK